MTDKLETPDHDDLALDALLRMSARAEESAEAFVAEWERRSSLEPVAAVEDPAVATGIPLPPPLDVPLAEPPIAPPAGRPDQPRVRPAAPALQQWSASGDRRGWQLVAIVASCLALVATGVAGVWYGRYLQNAETVSKDPVETHPPAPRKQIPPKAPGKTPEKIERNPWDGARPRDMARVTPDVRRPFPEIEGPGETRVTPAVWKVGGPRDGELSNGRHELSSGVAQIDWNDATRIELIAPVRFELRDDGTLALTRGRLRATDFAEPESPLPLTTPTSRLAAHRGSFVVHVDDSGATDFKVDRGELRVEPGRAEAAAAAALRLAVGEFDAAHIAALLADDAKGPLFSTLTGPGERFRGQIQINGESLRFGSPAAFDEFRDELLASFEKAPEKLISGWPDLVKKLHGMGGAAVAVEREGKLEEFRSLEDLLRLLPAAPAPGGVSFQGSINIDGKELKFDSPAEFEAAQKELFGPFNLFGKEPPGKVP